MNTFINHNIKFFFQSKTLLYMALLIIFHQQLFSQQMVRDSILHNGNYRCYNLYIPASYSTNQSVPLLFNFHGLGQTASAQMLYADFRTIADTANFILVLPEGTLLSGISYWNVGLLVSQVDDIDFVSKLIDTISSNYNITQNKVFATGFSNGAFLCHLLASRINKFAAIAGVSGSITPDNFDSLYPSRPIPVMIIHGTSDNIVPYNGLSNSEPIDDVVNYWVAFNNCNTTPTIITIPDTNLIDAANAQKFIYSSGNNGVSVGLIKILNGGHTWPGTAYFTAGTCLDFNACIEIWNFFRNNSIVSSIENYNKGNEEIIFYNPKQKCLEIINNIRKNYTIEIFSAAGIRIIEKKNQSKIDLNGISDGIYLIKVISKDGIYSKKFIKN